MVTDQLIQIQQDSIVLSVEDDKNNVTDDRADLTAETTKKSVNDHKIDNIGFELSVETHQTISL